MSLGAGDDLFTMQAGDGRDTLEGQAGNDAIRFSGTAAGEQFDVSAAGQRARLSAGGAVAVDAGDVEALSVFSFGGADRLARRRPVRKRADPRRRQPLRLRGAGR